MKEEAAVKQQAVKRNGVSQKVRAMTSIAMLSAVAFVLMLLDFSVPAFIPSFVKMDFSELPALIGSFAFGPVAGALVCLVKNLLHLFMTTTGGVGELCNFLLGVLFVVPAGICYKIKKNRTSAIIGSLVGAVVMAVVSVPVNAYITYPIYTKFLPIEQIIAMYQAINPKVDALMSCLIMFNMPFNFVKCLCSVIITVLIYKKLSPILKGKGQE